MMKDKLKGLLIGLLVGSMMTGTAAYAANSQAINVYFLQLKFMFDGVEKALGGATTLVYDNRAYVPIREVAKVLGKEIEYDGKTGTIWIGDRNDGTVTPDDGRQQGTKPQNMTIAEYEGGQVTQAEFDTFNAMNTFYYGQSAPADREAALKQLVALRTLAAKAEAQHGAAAAQDVDMEYGQILKYFGDEANLNAQLARSKLTSDDVKAFVRRHFLAGKALEASIGDAEIQAEYDRRRAADPAAFVTANIRHILIATTDDGSGKARTDDEALARADEVRAKLVAGADFAALANTYSDDPGSKDNGGLYANAALNQFVEPFKQAGLSQPIGEIGQPVKTDYGYHIIVVDSRSEKTAAEARDELLPALMNAAFQSYYDDVVPGLIKRIALPDAS